MNTLNQSVATLIRANGIQSSMKTFLTKTDAANLSSPKCSCAFRTLFGNSVFVFVLTIGFVFGSISGSGASAPVAVQTATTTIISSAWTVKNGMFSQDDNINGQKQFTSTAILQPSHRYIWFTTTYSPKITKELSIISSGSAITKMNSTKALITSTTRRAVTTSPVVTSSYSAVLSSSSATFFRPNGDTGYYYYQAIRMTVFTSGAYVFTSNSSIDTYGYFYRDPVDPSYPHQNLITSNDDGNSGRQFQVSVTLQYGCTYVLVVTTFGANVTGSFSISAVGPASIWLTSITPSTSRPIRITTATSTRLATTSPTVASSYSAVLSSSSATFFRPNGATGYYYYQAIRMTVSTSGTYVFTSSSSIDTYGYFYSDSVDPFSPFQNLITSNDDGNSGRQFQVSVTLQYGSTYVLVVTTFGANVTGSFSITALGPAWINLNSITLRTTTASPLISSSYFNFLSSSSPIFSRPGTTTNYYFYQAIRVTVRTAGAYVFTSNSSTDTYGYFYYDPVNPSYPSRNLIVSDDDSDGARQFRINVTLQYGSTYVLVVTTHATSATGSFWITARGPAWIDLTSITLATTDGPCANYSTCKTNQKLNTKQIVGITFGCIIFVVIVLSLCVYRHKRKRAAIQRAMAWVNNQNIRAQIFTWVNIDRNTRSANEIQIPYPSSMFAVATIREEEPPPSYESVVASLTAQHHQQSNVF